MLKASSVGALLLEPGAQDLLKSYVDAGFTFAQAVDKTCMDLSVSVETRLPLRQSLNERVGQRRLFAVMEIAAQFYSNYLWLSTSESAQRGRAYLSSRGIHPHTAATFRLGVSSEDNGLSRRFAYQGVGTQSLLMTGLGYDGGGDFFRNRLILPVLNAAGKVHGFGGRRLVDTESVPKYINSPTTLLFDKGHALYSPPGLQQECARAGYVILVEGYLDVVAMWQAGFRNVCALMGVAASKGQVDRLARISGTLVVALDPDTAGDRASYSAAHQLTQRGLDVRVAALGLGDPDEILQTQGGHGYISSALTSSQPFDVTDRS